MQLTIDGSAEDAAFESWMVRVNALIGEGQMYLDEYVANGGNLHTIGACNRTIESGGPMTCVIHRPTTYRLTGSRQILRRGGLIEDECEHGVGHPNPDSVAYFRWRNPEDNRSLHGCDGCCGPEMTEDDIEDHAAERFI